MRIGVGYDLHRLEPGRWCSRRRQAGSLSPPLWAVSWRGGRAASAELALEAETTDVVRGGSLNAQIRD